MGSAAVTITPDAAPVTITPDAAQQQPEKPGMWQRFREAVGLPSLDELKASMAHKPTTGEMVTRAVAGPAEPAYNVVKNYATTVGRGIAQGAQDVGDAFQNISEGGPVGANLGKAAYGATHAVLQATPFVGNSAENVGNDIHEGNYSGAVGGAAGALTTAAMPEIAERGGAMLSKAKNALVVSPELKAAAAAVPDAETAAVAARSAKEINTGAAAEVNNLLHNELDSVAKEYGVDVSNTNSARVKAHRIGDSLQKSAQEAYAKADQVAKSITGQPGRFQDIAENIRELKDSIRLNYDPEIKAKLTEQLKAAQDDYAAYTQEMEAKGMPPGFVKQADKQWSIGSSFKEVGTKLGSAEYSNGDLVPSARPLDRQVRSISREGEKRGHVLKNAMGEDRANRVVDAVQSAGDKVARETAATKAAKESVKATNESAAAAQKRVDAVKKNRRVLATGAATAVLGGGAVKYGSALFGDKHN